MPGHTRPHSILNIQKLSAVAIIAAGLHVAAARDVTFYVAPGGNDQWSGRKPRPGFLLRDGPFATVPRAVAAARAFRKRPQGTNARIIINLREGAYFLKEPLRLLPEDSGLVFTGPGTLSGGIRITNWWAGSINGRTALIASVPPGLVFHQLWVNGKRATPARHPNTNYFKIESVPDKTAAWQIGQSRFVYKAGDVAGWKDIDPQAKVVVMCRWVESHLPIAGIDPETRTLRFKKRAVFQLAPGDLWYMQGLMDVIDATGEWFLDSQKQTVYYLPREGESPENIVAIAPVLQQVLRIEGEPAKGRFVSDVSFQNVTFSHTEWNLPPAKEGPELESGGAAQAAVNVPGSVYAAGLRNSQFQGCTFRHLGAYGLELGIGCQDNVIAKCEFSDLAAGGLKIGEPAIRTGQEQTSGAEVRDSRFFDGGKAYHSAVGIWIGQSPNNTILRNEIHDFYYTGISIGWTWGYGRALATNNLVASNHVHHIGVLSNGDGPILSDMGGIYTLGMQPGTRIINNLWHDIAGLRYGGWGIYFDEGSSSILAASNIVYNTTHGGFHQHYGATNRVWNNVFAFARDHQLQRTRHEEHISFSFRTNIVVIDQGVFLGGNWHGHMDTGQNLFYDLRAGGGTNKTFAGQTLKDWQAMGNETNSIFADPMFRDLKNRDFNLDPKSPARALGFQPITTPLPR